jgi:hypothetical protein
MVKLSKEKLLSFPSVGSSLPAHWRTWLSGALILLIEPKESLLQVNPPLARVFQIGRRGDEKTSERKTRTVKILLKLFMQL